MDYTNIESFLILATNESSCIILRLLAMADKCYNQELVLTIKQSQRYKYFLSNLSEITLDASVR